MKVSLPKVCSFLRVSGPERLILLRQILELRYTKRDEEMNGRDGKKILTIKVKKEYKVVLSIWII